MPILFSSFFITTPFITYTITSFFGNLFFNFQIFIFLSQWFLALAILLVAFTDPGQIRKDTEPFPSKVTDEDISCRICKVLKSDNADHCFSCGTCVVGLDHHCPMLGNCIGRNNILLFRCIPYLFLGVLIANGL